VDADAYRGARPEKTAAQQAYRDLAALGIRTIINLESKGTADTEQATVNEALGPGKITVISFPINLWHIFLLSTSHEQIKDGLFKALQSAPKPVFIHCQHGKDRTGAVVLLYRLKRTELGPGDAYKEARHYRFSRFNFGLKGTIHRYERKPDKLADLPDPASGSAYSQMCVGQLDKRQCQ
jgi:tyrosine-protein phosphatase SIW14